MKNFFTILGGMGTLATESFIRVLNSRVAVTKDQDYLNYILVNHATIPDRTSFIVDRTLPSPIAPLKEDLAQQTLLQPNFFVLTCNTAHTFYQELQASTAIEILHMPRLAATQAALMAEARRVDDKKPRIMILASQGTVNSDVYGQEFDHQDYEIIYPAAALQAQVTNLIYRDIKEHQFFNEDLYQAILTTVFDELGCQVAVLGCTELSLMAERRPDLATGVVDAQGVLVDETIERALAARI